MTETDSSRQVIHISVRNLVEFLLRTGDIDDREGSHDTYRAMQEGSRIHRKIQRKMGSDYHAEVPLAVTIDLGSYDLSVEGRADGIFFDEREIPCGIDEIKGVYLDLDRLKEPIPVHLAQARVYAYIIASENSLDTVSVQMTYCNLDTEEIRRFREELSFPELDEWFHSLIEEYRPWSDYEVQWQEKMIASVHSLEFPYEYREGQKKLAADVYFTIRDHKELFIEAPTGSGKTLAVIYPSLKAVAEGLAERIFYLTAKNVTKQAALSAFQLLTNNGYHGKTIVLTGRDRMCLLPERKCNPEDCPYAKGHFDRVNDAVYELLTTEDTFSMDRIRAFSEERNVCPFEFSLDLASWCDNILCDYNYVFDPNASLRRFFGEGQNSHGILLIDEAHNMIDRAREMYSATLVKEDVLRMKRILKTRDKRSATLLDRVNRSFLAWKHDCQKILLLPEIDEFQFQLLNLSAALDKFLEKRIPFPEREEVVTFYFSLRDFLARAEEMDEGFRIYCDYSDDGEFRIHIFCIDPARELQSRIDQAEGTVYFSATFLPIRYYKSLLTADEDPYAVYAKSVFSPDQSRILIGTDVTSRYKARSEDMYLRYAKYLQAMVASHPGNYLAFFPSYQFLENVNRAYQTLSPSGKTLLQKADMTEEERSSFLQEFEQDHPEGLLGFSVLGGLFSEGIDLTGERLVGAAIVGTGLPQVSSRQNLLRNYFDAKEETKNDGFAYAYTYPGMARVLQAAGRVIRTEKDRGVILLLDDRFTWSEYRRNFPREWNSPETCTLETVQGKLQDFWEEQDDEHQERIGKK